MRKHCDEAVHCERMQSADNNLTMTAPKRAHVARGWVLPKEAKEFLAQRICKLANRVCTWRRGHSHQQQYHLRSCSIWVCGAVGTVNGKEALAIEDVSKLPAAHVLWNEVVSYTQAGTLEICAIACKAARRQLRANLHLGMMPGRAVAQHKSAASTSTQSQCPPPVTALLPSCSGCAATLLQTYRGAYKAIANHELNGDVWLVYLWLLTVYALSGDAKEMTLSLTGWPACSCGCAPLMHAIWTWVERVSSSRHHLFALIGLNLPLLRQRTRL